MGGDRDAHRRRHPRAANDAGGGNVSGDGSRGTRASAAPAGAQPAGGCRNRSGRAPPPEHTPRPPLEHDAACLRQLAALPLDAALLAPVAGENACGIATPLVIAEIGIEEFAVALAPTALVDCSVAGALTQWLEEDVQPATRSILGQWVVGVRVASSYACRSRNNDPTQPLSEHAFGRAIDISAFQLADGTWVTVRPFEVETTPEAEFITAIRAGACGPVHYRPRPRRRPLRRPPPSRPRHPWEWRWTLLPLIARSSGFCCPHLFVDLLGRLGLALDGEMAPLISRAFGDGTSRYAGSATKRRTASSTTSGSTPDTTAPVSPSTITSLNTPTSVATTGRPHAIVKRVIRIFSETRQPLLNPLPAESIDCHPSPRSTDHSFRGLPTHCDSDDLRTWRLAVT